MLKDLGCLSYFLGISISYDTGKIFINQGQYIKQLLDRNRLSDCQATRTPCEVAKISKHSGVPLKNPTQYRRTVGALQYITLSCPNIYFSVNQVCQFMHKPTNVHVVVKWILQYLKDMLNESLMFSPSNFELNTFNTGKFSLNAFCDVDYVGNLNDKRSFGGFYMFLGTNPISWCAKK
jgi:histone deacetylase 1/2